MLEAICKSDLTFMTILDYVYGALAVAERERWPRLGISTTRRALSQVCLRYNDERIECIACFVCAQLRTTREGYPAIDLTSKSKNTMSIQREIGYETIQTLGDL